MKMEVRMVMRTTISLSVISGIGVVCCAFVCGCGSLSARPGVSSEGEGSSLSQMQCPKVGFDGEDVHVELLIIPIKDDYFSKGIEGRSGDTVPLHFRIWNVSKKMIAVVTGPKKISGVVYFQKQSKRPIKGGNILTRGGERTLAASRHLTLLSGFGKTRDPVQPCYVGFDYELLLPEADVNELDAHLYFEIGVFVGDRVNWVNLEKAIPLRLKPDGGKSLPLGGDSAVTP